ncbi:MAG: cyclic pyranopterin monophosphate synthase MoaC [Candidatus Oxydemutatoraceae bacterium WSBS_2016_MAG_OTU14]
MNPLTHFNKRGEAHMVDISAKKQTARIAVAAGEIQMKKETLAGILQQAHHKGDVLGIARIGAIMAAKKTSELIPLCHPLSISSIEVEFKDNEKTNTIKCICTVQTTGQTGVEMEALVATQTALLTIYDMCKAVDRGMTMSNICLLKKSGGKSGDWERPA